MPIATKTTPASPQFAATSQGRLQRETATSWVSCWKAIWSLEHRSWSQDNRWCTGRVSPTRVWDGMKHGNCWGAWRERFDPGDEPVGLGWNKATTETQRRREKDRRVTLSERPPLPRVRPQRLPARFPESGPGEAAVATEGCGTDTGDTACPRASCWVGSAPRTHQRRVGAIRLLPQEHCCRSRRGCGGGIVRRVYAETTAQTEILASSVRITWMAYWQGHGSRERRFRPVRQ